MSSLLWSDDLDAAIHPTPGNGGGHHPTGPGIHSLTNDPMLADALRQSRAKTVRSDDMPDPPPEGVRPTPVPDVRPLRWDAEPRIEAALFEALEGLSMEGTTLFASLGQRTPVITIKRPHARSSYMAQAQLVQRASDQRGDRMAELLIQCDGLWPFWTAITGIDPAVAPRTFEFMSLGQAFVTSVVMRMKYAVASPRPVDFSPRIQPVIRTPGHGSLPSGHATSAFFGAALLMSLKSTRPGLAMGKQLMRLARRISQSRVVAGVHFPMDSVAGRALGTSLAAYFLARAGADTVEGLQLRSGGAFDGTLMDGDHPNIDPTKVMLAPMTDDSWGVTLPAVDPGTEWAGEIQIDGLLAEFKDRAWREIRDQTV